MGTRVLIIAGWYYHEERMVPQLKDVMKRLIKYSSPHPQDEPLGLRFSDLLKRIEQTTEPSPLEDRATRQASLTVVTDATVTCEQSGVTLRSEAQSTLLETLEAGGLNPKFGCRKGRCHTCTCKMASGRVYNTRTGLETEGEELIQICVSQPLGDVKLDV